MRGIPRALALLAVTAFPAAAQQASAEQIPFEGGAFTITETEGGEKALAYDGQLLAQNYVLYLDRMVEVAGVKVALFDIGDGGNACGTSTLVAWKPPGGIESDFVGQECGAPPASIGTERIYFVPFPAPGATEPVQVWSPQDGLRLAGTLAFAPQPGTGWGGLDPDAMNNIVDAFDNESVYQAARKLLGAAMTDFATGLLTGGGIEKTASGAIYGSGCVPHACGSADAFMAVDTKGRKVYMAQTGEEPQPNAWPALKAWPADIRAAMQAAIGRH